MGCCCCWAEEQTKFLFTPQHLANQAQVGAVSLSLSQARAWSCCNFFQFRVNLREEFSIAHSDGLFAAAFAFSWLREGDIDRDEDEDGDGDGEG